jgi:hypothetical protein
VLQAGGGDARRQTRFSDAAGTKQGYEAGAYELISYARQLVLAANEGCEFGRQIRLRRSSDTERCKLDPAGIRRLPCAGSQAPLQSPQDALQLGWIAHT